MRAATTDVLQSFRFHVVATDLPDAISFAGGIEGAEAGFQSVTLPEITVEAVEYREGTMKFTKKYPGVPSYSDGTLMRGVALTDTVFYDWCLTAATSGEYRTELVIWHYQREQDGAEVSSPVAAYEGTRAYRCQECLPIRAKPAADMDATSGEVSMAEVDFSTEYFSIETV